MNDSFTWLIHPLNVAEYASKYVTESGVVHLKRTSNHYSNILTSDNIDTILTTMSHRPIRIVHNGNLIASTDFKGGLAREAALEHFKNGASVILDNLQFSWGPLLQLCNDCVEALPNTRTISANAYLTPAWEQAFPRHTDHQNVLILQVEGTKRWKVYDIAAPSPSTKKIQKTTRTQKERKPIFDKSLQPGDFLFVPRGFPHEVTTEASHSLHISLVLIPFTSYDIINRALASAITSDGRLNRSLPFEFANKDHPFRAEKEILKSILTTPNLFNEAVRTLKSEQANNTIVYQAGAVKAILANNYRLSDDRIYKINLSILVHLKHKSKTISTITTLKREFDIEGANDTIKYIFNRPTFKLGDVPNSLTKQELHTLIKLLIDESLISPL